MKQSDTHRASSLSSRTRLAAVMAFAMIVTAGVFAKTNGARLLTTTNLFAARPDVSVALRGSIVRDDKAVALDTAEAVRPGEILTWTMSAENRGDAAARGLQAVGQIPPGTAFVIGSATPVEAATVTYSIDDSKTFSVQPMLEERQPDGSIKRSPAPAQMYTQIRYEWQDSLAAGATATASYKVRVR